MDFDKMDFTTQNVSINFTQENVTTTPDYDYPIVTDPPLEELIPVSIVYGFTLIFGILGNGLVIFSVSRYEQMMTITNTFLLSLASADLLLVMVCVPVKFAAFFSYMWHFGRFLCKAVHYIQNVSAICSVATLTVMSIERYYAILYPMRAKYVCTVGRARRVILCLWILSFILAIPILVGRVHIIVGIHRKASWCVKYWDSPTLGKIYEVYMFCVIFLVPVYIMSFTYFRICQELWFMSRPGLVIKSTGNDSKRFHYYNRQNGRYNSYNLTPNRWSNSEKSPVLKVKFTEDDSTKKQVIKMLVAIVLVFVICWAPILLNNILVAFDVLPELHVGVHKYLREAFHVMSYANSCVNPIVYGFMSRNFRQTFRRSLCGCLRGKQYVRKLTFKTQKTSNHTIREHWSSSTGDHHSELVSATDMLEMTETAHNSSSSDGVRV